MINSIIDTIKKSFPDITVGVFGHGNIRIISNQKLLLFLQIWDGGYFLLANFQSHTIMELNFLNENFNILLKEIYRLLNLSEYELETLVEEKILKEL